MTSKNFFTKNIICNSKNRRFNLIIGYFYSLIISCVWLAGKNIDISKKLYSREIERQFPEQETNLDKINFNQIVSGKLKQEFIYFYKELLSLWKKIQQERVFFDDKTGNISNKHFKKQLIELERLAQYLVNEK